MRNSDNTGIECVNKPASTRYGKQSLHSCVFRALWVLSRPLRDKLDAKWDTSYGIEESPGCVSSETLNLLSQRVQTFKSLRKKERCFYNATV